MLKRKILAVSVLLATCLIGCNHTKTEEHVSSKIVKEQVSIDQEKAKQETEAEKETEIKQNTEKDIEKEIKQETEIEADTEKKQIQKEVLTIETERNTAIDTPHTRPKVENKAEGTPEVEDAAAKTETINVPEKENAVVDESEEMVVSLSIDCKTILNHKEDFNPEKLELLPSDGVILNATEFTYEEGETVFDVLLRATKEYKIHMEFNGSNAYKTNYIEGIHNIYEFDCGPLSGWMYKVNGVFPNYGCSNYILQEGDVIEWVYTCDLGKDVGGENIF